VFGTLRLERGKPAVADVDGSRWVFEKSKSRLTPRTEDGSVLAAFAPAKRGEGLLTLADGRTLRWAATPPRPGRAGLLR